MTSPPARRAPAPDPATVPLGTLPPAGRLQAIEELLEVARDLGLTVNPRIKPALWAEVLADRSYDELERAVKVLSAAAGSPWLNTPGQLLAHVPEAVDPDVVVWDAIERAVATRGVCELAPLPEMTVRQFLAVADCGTLAWDLAHAEHPVTRRELREKFLTACRKPRPYPARLLAEPAAPHREGIMRARTLGILADLAPRLLPVNE